MYIRFKEKIRWFLYRGLYKPGHFYSPIPSTRDISRRKETIFAGNIPQGLKLNQDEQENLLKEFEQYVSGFNWPEAPDTANRYYKNNMFFNRTDAFILYCIMLHFKPKRIIEIGSGFSSALMLDVKDQFFKNTIELTFIEPFTERLRALLKQNDQNTQQCTILEQMVQDVDISVFRNLAENDILFIDSSHISKIGSDLNHILFNIIPVLKPGVIIHFHDICYPFEYPQEWIEEGIYWNEAYLLRAFLMYNDAFKILVFNNFWGKGSVPSLSHLNMVGGSLWLKKIK